MEKNQQLNASVTNSQNKNTKKVQSKKDTTGKKASNTQYATHRIQNGYELVL